MNRMEMGDFGILDKPVVVPALEPIPVSMSEKGDDDMLFLIVKVKDKIVRLDICK